MMGVEQKKITLGMVTGAFGLMLGLWSPINGLLSGRDAATAQNERQLQQMQTIIGQLTETRASVTAMQTQVQEMSRTYVELRTQSVVLQRDADRERENVDRRISSLTTSVTGLRDIIIRNLENAPRRGVDGTERTEVRPQNNPT